jgi:hypothetical protein
VKRLIQIHEVEEECPVAMPDWTLIIGHLPVGFWLTCHRLRDFRPLNVGVWRFDCDLDQEEVVKMLADRGIRAMQFLIC